MLLVVNEIVNIEKLIEKIENSKGNIFLQIDEEYYNLKEDEAGIRLMKREMNAKGRVKLHAFESKDYFSLINCIMG